MDTTTMDTTELMDTAIETTVDDILVEAVALIDQGLARLLHRELVSAAEAADVLLDVRLLLTTATELERVPLS